MIGWSPNKDMSTENTTLAAFKMAKKSRFFEEELIFHSDLRSTICKLQICKFFRVL